LAQLFIKEMGLFPPGFTVRLNSGEIGIVTGTGNNASSPDVDVIIDAKGEPLKRAIYRDTLEKSYAIADILALPEHPFIEKLLADMWPRVARRG